MKAPIDVSIIIVNYNTKELTLSCLQSLLQSKKTSDNWEILVVDNASEDESQKALVHVIAQNQSQKIYFIQNSKNTGFAHANNIAMKRARGRYILLLNSDTQVHHDTIATMVSFMDEHKKAGAATCAVFLVDGSLDPACHRGFPTPWAAFTYFLKLEHLFPTSHLFGQYHKRYMPMTKAHTIDSPSGAFFFVRKEVISQVGLLDEDYFMYGEDIDWAYRIKLHGWDIWYNPQTSIIHHKKQSGRAHANPIIRKKTQRYFYKTMLLFYEKHYQKIYPWFVTAIIGGLLRFRIVLLDTLSL